MAAKADMADMADCQNWEYPIYCFLALQRLPPPFGKGRCEKKEIFPLSLPFPVRGRGEIC